MTGTPSRTTTAYGGGTPRHSVGEVRFYTSRQRRREGMWGGSCRQNFGPRDTNRMRRPHDGRGRMGVQSPIVIRVSDRICGGYMKRKSRALPREICLSANGVGSLCYTGDELQAREAIRSTMGRQKSAESISCPRTATKEEHEEMNRNGVFDE
jgi:hypothetical protein